MATKALEARFEHLSVKDDNENSKGKVLIKSRKLVYLRLNHPASI